VLISTIRPRNAVSVGYRQQQQRHRPGQQQQQDQQPLNGSVGENGSVDDSGTPSITSRAAVHELL
jgi:hypothetical protein